MSKEIEKFRSEEVIRIAFLKHRGDVLKIAAETGHDLTYVKKITSKIKKRQQRDVDRLVANDIARAILCGAEQREHIYLTYLNSLEGKETALVSQCCNVPVKKYPYDDIYNCTKCLKTCGTKVIEKREIYGLVLKFAAELRKESKFLMDFAIKMGFTDKIEPPVTKITQYNVALPGSVLTDDKDVKILRSLELLSGPERQQLRRKLTQEIVDAKFEEKNESGPEENTNVS